MVLRGILFSQPAGRVDMRRMQKIAGGSAAELYLVVMLENGIEFCQISMTFRMRHRNPACFFSIPSPRSVGKFQNHIASQIITAA